MDRRWAVRGVVGLTAFITMLDNTVVTAAAPSIARDLGVALPTLEWVAAAYMVAFAGLMLAGAGSPTGTGTGACCGTGSPRSPPRRRWPPWPARPPC
ncbi:hypothetical protein [Phytohabitans rumicis]|uniref:Major facilitator superfamily (MFS) profile domain-containing protein n=1 Tax=Phytohabitans rumicis TaxID=1076125 RepID=A0A6V8L0Z4_9ACTN|nr:hypothetical protein [Phytohabitans rumicis]GFJ88471.1 hypothetical protein Prum_021130 [Phytohabitans rumicis]